MKTKKEESFENLQDFIYRHKLRDKNSNVIFNANVSIRTESNFEKRKMPIIVDFNVYNKLAKITIEDYDLNAYLFPITFFPDSDKITHVDNLYLKIEGTHTKNADIGKYCIEIYPLG